MISSSQNGDSEEYHLLGCEAPFKGHPVSRLLCLPPALKLVSCTAHSSILKMEAICSSVTSVDFQRTTRGYISENRTLLSKIFLSFVL
jgi:hypothetical protein